MSARVALSVYNANWSGWPEIRSGGGFCGDVSFRDAAASGRSGFSLIKDLCAGKFRWEAVEVAMGPNSRVRVPPRKLGLGSFR